jgi:hypothetical protein
MRGGKESACEAVLPERIKGRLQSADTPRELEVPPQTVKASFVEPMLLLPSSTLPEGPAWAYELNLDGYRAIAIKANGRVQLRPRNNKYFNRKIPAVAEALAKFLDEKVIDGEIVAPDDSGRPWSNALQLRLSECAHLLYVFDVLVQAGHSSRSGSCEGFPMMANLWGTQEISESEKHVRRSDFWSHMLAGTCANSFVTSENILSKVARLIRVGPCLVSTGEMQEL